MAIRQKGRKRQNAIYAKLESFFQEMEKQYGISRDEIQRVVDELGTSKGQLRTYCIVQSHMRKKQVPG